MFNRKVASIKKQSFTGSLHCSEKVPKIHKKTQESLFQLNCTVWTCNFIKKEIPHRPFPVKFSKFFRTAFLQSSSWRLSLPITTSFSFMISKKGMYIYQIYIRYGQARKCCRIAAEIRPTFVQSNSKAPTD